MRWLQLSLAVGLLAAGLAAACGSTSNDSAFNPGGGGDQDAESMPPIFDPNHDGAVDPDASALSITPLDPVLTYTGGAAPTVTFVAKNAGGVQVPATFQIDRGEIGSETQAGVFTASGAVGGKATITATWNGHTAATSVTVKLALTQNGETLASDAGADGGGAGGYGGVGGEGPGGAVSADQMATLKSAPQADTGLAFLYPYDKTVWPRGILAPLLQWKPGAQGDYDAVRIQINETNFTYDGFFGRPTGANPFQRHPVPQLAWKQMLTSNAGEDVTITITLAKGTTAYGPITEKWKVASAPLKGVVYYNSYGTKLAKNFTGALHPPGGSDQFGAATLAIRGGSTDPVLVAGQSGDQSQCRVCHSVAANGSKLITQRNLGDQRKFSTYDLKTGFETTMSPEGTNADFAWAAIYPDGSMFLNDSSPAAGSRVNPNQLWSTVSGAGPQSPALIPNTNWPSGFNAAYPSFSPDGKHVAFTMYSGATGADTRSIGTMTFDATTKTFGALTPLYTPDANTKTAIFVSFLPTNDAVVFELETQYNGRDYGGTRSGCDDYPPKACATTGTHAELWWLDLKTKTAHPLDRLNGEGYLPTDPANAHDDDTSLNYEPTVNPVPSGGYAWVVFTSRRLYGNVATINPFFSDPRFVDLTSTPTPKKLWVAAIDLNAPPGTDPSHPAFYLPAQELLAGNSRGYWVVDPCRSDGSSCESGDECCGGYCRPAGDGGGLVCTAQAPMCAQEFEKCSQDGDCCNSAAYKCINQRCALPLPN